MNTRTPYTKKHLIIILLLLNASLTRLICAHSLVFVHIGPSLPSYFFDAHAQARLFNPDCPIYLLADQEALDSCKEVCAHDPNFYGITLESLTRSEAHQTYLETSAFNHKDCKWGIFWVYASERFFYLDEFMSQHEVQDVFHLENDIMLYTDLASLLPTFKKKYPGIAASFDNDYKCTPGFMYIAHKGVMRQLRDCFVHHGPNIITDMHIIGDFKNCNPPEVIDSLPVIMDSYINRHGLKSPTGETTTKPRIYSNNLESFNSLFDAAALGQYIGGTHTDATPGFINGGCLFNPSLLTYEWHADEKNRMIPYAVFEGARYRINNLHIHSKKLKEFSSLKEKRNEIT